MGYDNLNQIGGLLIPIGLVHLEDVTSLFYFHKSSIYIPPSLIMLYSKAYITACTHYRINSSIISAISKFRSLNAPKSSFSSFIQIYA